MTLTSPTGSPPPPADPPADPIDSADTAQPVDVAGRASADPVPLCVDLDGTLLRTDLLWESLFAMLGETPGTVMNLPGWLKRGKAHLKHEIAQRVVPDAAFLPYRPDVLEFLYQQEQAGAR